MNLTLSNLWFAIAALILVAVVVELVLGRLLNAGLKPIDQICRRLPRKIQVTLTILLCMIAVGAWIYGCSLQGF